MKQDKQNKEAQLHKRMKYWLMLWMVVYVLLYMASFLALLFNTSILDRNDMAILPISLFATMSFVCFAGILLMIRRFKRGWKLLLIGTGMQAAIGIALVIYGIIIADLSLVLICIANIAASLCLLLAINRQMMSHNYFDVLSRKTEEEQQNDMVSKISAFADEHPQLSQTIYTCIFQEKYSDEQTLAYLQKNNPGIQTEELVEQINLFRELNNNDTSWVEVLIHLFIGGTIAVFLFSARMGSKYHMDTIEWKIAFFVAGVIIFMIYDAINITIYRAKLRKIKRHWQ